VEQHSGPVVIVGGGLSGWMAAAHLGRRHVPTLVINDSDVLGGRARTFTRDGFHFNFGPHRLFGGGAAIAGLRELGITINAVTRGPNGGLAIFRGRAHTLPLGHCSLMTTTALQGTAKLEFARILLEVPRLDLSTLQTVGVQAWLDGRVNDSCVRSLLRALICAATYCSDLERLSAAAGLQQLALALRGPVLSVHEGWGTMVRAVQDDALGLGVKMRVGHAVVAVETQRDAVQHVILANGDHIRCRAVIVATNPRHARQLFGDAVSAIDALTPVRAATLDVALRGLPAPRSVFAFGVDVPLCCCVDSAIARVAPPGAAVIHAAKYLRTDEPGTARDEEELEQFLDLVQPGWRSLVVHRRYLSAMVVSHALVAADTGGFHGRPDIRVEGKANAYLAGDWIGPTGQLADAAVASALRAARATERLIGAS